VAVPPKLAVVMGREADGVSQAMLQAADLRVYLDMFGFTESFNLSVASALVIQSLFGACPEARGDLTAESRRALRADWYGKLNRKAKDPENRRRFEGYLRDAEAAEERVRVDANAAGPLMLADLREEGTVATIYKPLRKRMEADPAEASRMAVPQ
jgi:tRNA C32,U32 (ribose-2'-O)-methylase TrmJ